ncbi:MAG: hypothetical protein HQK51_18945 [Oligoflexia bacterium]|nr:hypothetical protein [Oligoflexia bacterium]
MFFLNKEATVFCHSCHNGQSVLRFSSKQLKALRPICNDCELIIHNGQEKNRGLLITQKNLQCLKCNSVFISKNESRVCPRCKSKNKSIY